jgi:hypothetical protein
LNSRPLRPPVGVEWEDVIVFQVSGHYRRRQILPTIVPVIIIATEVQIARRARHERVVKIYKPQVIVSGDRLECWTEGTPLVGRSRFGSGVERVSRTDVNCRWNDHQNHRDVYAHEVGMHDTQELSITRVLYRADSDRCAGLGEMQTRDSITVATGLVERSSRDTRGRRCAEQLHVRARHDPGFLFEHDPAAVEQHSTSAQRRHGRRIMADQQDSVSGRN